MHKKGDILGILELRDAYQVGTGFTPDTIYLTHAQRLYIERTHGREGKPGPQTFGIAVKIHKGQHKPRMWFESSPRDTLLPGDFVKVVQKDYPGKSETHWVILRAPFADGPWQISGKRILECRWYATPDTSIEGTPFTHEVKQIPFRV